MKPVASTPSTWYSTNSSSSVGNRLSPRSRQWSSTLMAMAFVSARPNTRP